MNRFNHPPLGRCRDCKHRMHGYYTETQETSSGGETRDNCGYKQANSHQPVMLDDGCDCWERGDDGQIEILYNEARKALWCWMDMYELQAP